MTRHLTDRPKARGSAARLKNFLRVQRALEPRLGTKLLQRRARHTNAHLRNRAYLRLLRQV